MQIILGIVSCCLGLASLMVDGKSVGTETGFEFIAYWNKANKIQSLKGLYGTIFLWFSIGFGFGSYCLPEVRCLLLSFTIFVRPRKSTLFIYNWIKSAFSIALSTIGAIVDFAMFVPGVKTCENNFDQCCESSGRGVQKRPQRLQKTLSGPVW